MHTPARLAVTLLHYLCEYNFCWVLAQWRNCRFEWKQKSLGIYAYSSFMRSYSPFQGCSRRSQWGSLLVPPSQCSPWSGRVCHETLSWVVCAPVATTVKQTVSRRRSERTLRGNMSAFLWDTISKIMDMPQYYLLFWNRRVRRNRREGHILCMREGSSSRLRHDSTFCSLICPWFHLLPPPIITPTPIGILKVLYKIL